MSLVHQALNNKRDKLLFNLKTGVNVNIQNSHSQSRFKFTSNNLILIFFLQFITSDSI